MKNLIVLLTFALLLSACAFAQTVNPCTTLPAGITMTPDGDTANFGGTPTTAETCTVTIQACDSATPTNCATSVQTVTINPSPVSVSGSLGSGTVGKPYSGTLSCSAPSGSCTWTVVQPSPPPSVVATPSQSITPVPAAQ